MHAIEDFPNHRTLFEGLVAGEIESLFFLCAVFIAMVLIGFSCWNRTTIWIAPILAMAVVMISLAVLEWMNFTLWVGLNLNNGTLDPADLQDRMMLFGRNTELMAGTGAITATVAFILSLMFREGASRR